jgi:hypothetical protein
MKMSVDYCITKAEFRKIAKEGGSFYPDIYGDHEGRFECKFENGKMEVLEDYDLLATIRYKSVEEAWTGWKECVDDLIKTDALMHKAQIGELKDLARKALQECIKALRGLKAEDFDLDVYDMVGAMVVYREILRGDLDEAQSTMTDAITYGSMLKIDKDVRSMLEELENW